MPACFAAGTAIARRETRDGSSGLRRAAWGGSPGHDGVRLERYSRYREQVIATNESQLPPAQALLALVGTAPVI